MSNPNKHVVAICEANGCTRDRRGAGAYCNKHRQRVRKHGDPEYWGHGSLRDRMESRVDKSGDCWIWTGVLSSGYGQIWDNGRMQLVHRLMYELLIGPIPVGLQIDHLCRTPACCNPAHLEPVTPSENIRRGLRGVLKGAKSK